MTTNPLNFNSFEVMLIDMNIPKEDRDKILNYAAELKDKLVSESVVQVFKELNIVLLNDLSAIDQVATKYRGGK